VVKSVLKDLQAKGLGSGAKIVLAGCSAGAMGATVLCDFVERWLPSSITDIKVSCIFDSNLPVLDTPSLEGGGPHAMARGVSMASMATDWVDFFNIEGVLHPSCLEKLTADEQWKCVFPEHVMAELTTPWFVSANRFDAYGALMETSGTGLLNDMFDYLWPFGDDHMNAWGKAQETALVGLPSSDQPHSAIFQAGCAMHCGMQGALYGNVNAGDGTTMKDAIQKWFSSLDATTPVEDRLWVDDEDFIAARGSCWGYSDIWICLFRSLFLVWVAWAVHLTQTKRSGTDVNALLQQAATGAARAAGKPELVPAVFGPRENKIGWCSMCFVFFLLCVVGRYV
jgi:hypothetical protein